jgi:hypothetical protein
MYLFGAYNKVGAVPMTRWFFADKLGPDRLKTPKTGEVPARVIKGFA